MQKCPWSWNTLCHAFVVKGTITKVSCDGLKDRSCLGKFNIEDIRDRRPTDCPDPLCILDFDNTGVCQSCPRKLPNPPQTRGWGGRRAGAGAPKFNLNRLAHGAQSKLMKIGIERMIDDPTMHAVLLIITRLALSGEVPPQTRRTIQAAMRRKGVKL